MRAPCSRGRAVGGSPGSHLLTGELEGCIHRRSVKLLFWHLWERGDTIGCDGDPWSGWRPCWGVKLEYLQAGLFGGKSF